MCFEIVLPVYHSIQNVIFNKNFQAKLLIIQIVLTFIALQDYIIMSFFSYSYSTHLYKNGTFLYSWEEKLSNDLIFPNLGLLLKCSGQL